MGKKRPVEQEDVPAALTTTRLHITPLTAETAPALLPASLLTPEARASISYHTLPAFPEKPFGYVDLPSDAAKELRKKLHNLMFRGVKVRVWDALPSTWENRLEEGKETEEERRERKRVKRAKKEAKKAEEGVVKGVQLPDDRKVARGWVEKTSRNEGEKDKERKKERREKKEKGECLFKAGIPPNKADLLKEKKKKNVEGEVVVKQTKEEKALEKELVKEEKREKKKDARKKRVIKEFENTQKFPSFLKSSQLDPTRGPTDMVGEFVEEVGWVDGKGTVVEVKPKSRKERKKEEAAAAAAAAEAAAAAAALLEPVVVKEPTPDPDAIEIVKATENDRMDVDAMSDSSEEEFNDIPETKEKASSPAAEEDSESEDEAEEADTMEIEPTVAEPEVLEEESEAEVEAEAESSDESEAEVESDAEVESEAEVEANANADAESSDDSSAEEDNESSDSDSDSKATPASKKKPSLQPIVTVHPLEALYKPATAPTDDLDTASAFKFGFAAENDSDDEAPTVSTPHRDPSRYRSSAPTPETAIGSKRFFSPASVSDDESSDTFAPSTPRAPFSHSQGSDAPLMFLHEESRFLKGLSLWQQLPQPKALLPKEPVEGEDKEVVEDKVTDPVELWKRLFYEQRGEWNRDWKRKRREGMKAKRKRERTGPGASGANRA